MCARFLTAIITPRLCAAVILVAIMAAGVACSSGETGPRVEEFPGLLLGTWAPQTGPVGTLRFEGSTESGVAIRSADGINAESFTYQWVAPAQIRTNLAGDAEFTILFEDNGKTLVLTTVAGAETREVLRYSRVAR
ncbi:MAG: hypothetical protein O3B04_08320 [Chloroflexi bacterium]|nr:hypothetical protein [Chloroflexota bacterium]